MPISPALSPQSQLHPDAHRAGLRGHISTLEAKAEASLLAPSPIPSLSEPSAHTGSPEHTALTPPHLTAALYLSHQLDSALRVWDSYPV